MSKILKSIWAVVAGFLTVFILSSAIDLVLQSLGVFPPPNKYSDYSTWMLVIALLYRSVVTVLGGYVTAYLSPKPKMRHVFILGILGIIGVFAGWNLSAHWYPIALAVSAFPLVYMGGKLRLAKK